MGQLPSALPPVQSSSALQAWGSRTSGRAIFANASHQQLLDNFRQLSTQQSSEGYHAQTLLKAVDSLRGPASPVNSMLKPNQPTRRLLVAGGFEIEYELNSYYGHCQTDVEIVDIRMAKEDAREERRSALWRIKFDQQVGWIPEEKEPRTTLTASPAQKGNKESPVKVGVNGHSRQLKYAADTLSKHISRGDKGKAASLQNSGFQLLYVPSTNSAIGAEWVSIKSLGLNGTDEQRVASRILAQHMLEAYQKGLYIEWTAHKDGAWVLTEAMRQLTTQRIDLQRKQKIFLSDAASSHVVADRMRHTLNMDTYDSSWHNTAPGPAQLVGGTHLGVAPLLCLVDEFRHRSNADEKFGTAGDLLWQAGTKGLVVSGAATAIISTAGVPMSLALLGASILIASLPSARDDYFKNPGQQLGSWLARLRKHN
ncbi:hypothetical protein [uncultured Microbulbifer sp.]|uniref:hypothetical protein n=1 Tax=uncultured Microbulbifer sp. TaxID=348147 RepID=UPI0025D0BBD1|nr:hypothetical protein [uncultured Microbulbifer sp.]